MTDCALCATKTEDEPHQVDVCPACHAALVASGHIPVTTTGEFSRKEMAAALAEDISTAPSGGTRARRTTGDQSSECTWCAKTEDEVARMFSQAGVNICSECIEFCNRILALPD